MWLGAPRGRLPGPPDRRRAIRRNPRADPRPRRVLGDDGEPLRGEYAVGWIKRGPSGVIGTNKKCAAGTVGLLVADAENGQLREPASQGDSDQVAEWLCGRAGEPITWEDWRAIDEHERRAGEPYGRPRVKLVRRDEMVSVARAGALSAT